MAAPARKRPGSSSPIILTPGIEPVRTPATEPVAEAQPAAAREEPRSAEAAPSQQREVPPRPLDGSEGVANAPDASLRLSVDVEAEPTVTPAATAPSAGEQPQEPEQPVAAAIPQQALQAPPTHSIFVPDTKTTITQDMPTRLKLRADTAVMRTQGYEGGYRSRAQLINTELERELIRLEAEFNGGEEFPPNLGAFRTGRPLGS